MVFLLYFDLLAYFTLSVAFFYRISYGLNDLIEQEINEVMRWLNLPHNLILSLRDA